jgi:hypothetical protein
MLYLCNPLTQLISNGQPALPAGTSFRWISQPPSEDWFKDSSGASCWVFDTEAVISGFESAPSVYPNGIQLLDDGVHKNYEIVIDQTAQTQQQAEQILAQLTPLANSDPLAVKNAINSTFTPAQLNGVLNAEG